jgi:hypothetical protein
MRQPPPLPIGSFMGRKQPITITACREVERSVSFQIVQVGRTQRIFVGRNWLAPNQ